MKTFAQYKDQLRPLLRRVSRILESQGDRDARLTTAVQNNDMAAAETAIAEGSRCAEYGNVDQNPAVIAIRTKNDAMLKLLLDKQVIKDGANARPNYYEGPLLAHAIRAGNVSAFEMLCAAGANLRETLQDDGGFVGLALQYKQLDIAQRLVAKDAPIDQANNNGWTPLFWTAQYGFEDFARLLLTKDARTYLYASSGMTVLDVARAAEKFGVYHIIQKHLDDAVPTWRKTGDDSIVHTEIARAAGYRLTQVFNFKTAQHTHITHNFATGQDVPVTKGLDALAQPELVAEAKAQLEKLKV